MPRAVGYTIQDPVPGDVKSLTIVRNSDGAGGFVLVCNAHYILRDENGNEVVPGSVGLQLTPAQSNSIATFITSNVIPLIVDVENL